MEELVENVHGTSVQQTEALVTLRVSCYRATGPPLEVHALFPAASEPLDYP